MGFGNPGTGKTRFFGGDKDCIFASTEPGQDFIKSRNVPITEWNLFKQLAVELANRKKAGNLDCSAVVIDIVDNLQAMCQASVCHKAGCEHPSDKKDFGKTWGEVTREWTNWIRGLLKITNVRFITHCRIEDIEITNANNLTEEITRVTPTFSASKAAQYLDGVVGAVGYFSKNKAGQHTISFNPTLNIAAKDRTDILSKLGVIVLPANPDEGFNFVSQLYNKKAKELGFEVRSKHSNN